MTDIVELKRLLNDRALDVAEHLLPRGVLEGRDWCAGSTAGETGRSLKVCVKGAKAGVWSDFAEGGDSGDLLDLWCAVRGQPLAEALDDVRRFLGVERPSFERQPRTYRRPERPQCQAPKSAVLDYLTRERLISADAIRAFRIGEQGRTIVLPSVLPDGALAGVKYLGVDRSTEGRKVIRVEGGCEPVLFGWQAVSNANLRECTITEGEIDAMTAWDYGLPTPLSVPFGGGKGAKQQWLEAEYDRLAQFEVIYLALDCDSEGDAAAAEIARRLGEHRCRRVLLPHKDLNACRQANVSAEDIRRHFDSARTADPEELIRAGALADDVVDLFWPTSESRQGYRLPWRKAGDKLRFRPGELTIWTGGTGEGKSQVLSHAVVDMASQGARACIASLEMAPAMLLKRAVKQAGNNDRPTEARIREVMMWLDTWLLLFGQVGKAGVTRLIEVFEYARRRYGCDVFVVDSLMRLGVGSEDYEGQERAVFELVTWAVAKGVHVHLVAHARKSDRSNGQAGQVPGSEDVKGTSEIASNAANIIGVWRNRRLEDELRQMGEAAAAGDAVAEMKLRELEDKPPVVINVAKQRNGDWEGKIGLWFNTGSYQYRSANDDRSGLEYVA
ncbi:replication protein / DNA helicase [Nitrospirillum viridazoti Y2]|uniref:Twinkle protein n=1 Tax=Nitrospirillum amazonense TaxID=28077 RepID=A0A560ITR8_9PROT|nr:AAA family ATPase [Nitrospirillum amazonense]EGY01393.1 replication protein / DNA helicase [Nitrospirillum amazonense Y2]TWB62237.1 twinkle protein [Nitrospirillum amazonense]